MMESDVGNTIFVIGGWHSSPTDMKSIHILDTVNNIWTERKTNGADPNPRTGHTISKANRGRKLV